jgi:hypothetical protein
MIHGSKPPKIFCRGADAYGAQFGSGSITEQLRQRANRTRSVASRRKMPESLTGAGVAAVLSDRCDKTRDALFVRGSKEEGLLKLTVTRELGLSWALACIFRDFPCAHVMKACDADATLLRNLIEHGADFLVRASQSHTKVASGTLGARDLEVKIAVGEKNSASALRNEGMAVF